MNIEDFIDDIKYYLNKPVYGYYNIRHFFKNLIYYIPFIWKDRNWSDHHIFLALYYKLKRQENYIRHGHFVGCEKEADNILFCIKLLESRILKDDYNNVSGYTKINEKWGDYDCKCKKSEIDGFEELILSRENVKTEEDEKLEKKEFMEAMLLEEYLKNQDIAYLFGFMRKHIRYWWD